MPKLKEDITLSFTRNEFVIIAHAVSQQLKRVSKPLRGESPSEFAMRKAEMLQLERRLLEHYTEFPPLPGLSKREA